MVLIEYRIVSVVIYLMFFRLNDIGGQWYFVYLMMKERLNVIGI